MVILKLKSPEDGLSSDRPPEDRRGSGGGAVVGNPDAPVKE